MRLTLSGKQIFIALVQGVAAGKREQLPDLYAEDAKATHPFATDASAVLVEHDRLREHFMRVSSRGLDVEVRDIAVHETTDPDVVVGEFAYHGRIARKRLKVPGRIRFSG